MTLGAERDFDLREGAIVHAAIGHLFSPRELLKNRMCHAGKGGTGAGRWDSSLDLYNLIEKSLYYMSQMVKRMSKTLMKVTLPAKHAGTARLLGEFLSH